MDHLGAYLKQAAKADQEQKGSTSEDSGTVVLEPKYFYYLVSCIFCFIFPFFAVTWFSFVYKGFWGQSFCFIFSRPAFLYFCNFFQTQNYSFQTANYNIEQAEGSTTVGQIHLFSPISESHLRLIYDSQPHEEGQRDATIGTELDFDLDPDPEEDPDYPGY